MNGNTNAGLQVRLRWMPHRDHEVEVFDARTGAYLGRAELADRAKPWPGQGGAAGPARASGPAGRELKDVERTRRQRYAASTVAEPPSRWAR